MDYIPVIASVEDLDQAIERAKVEPSLRYFVDKALTRWGRDPVEWPHTGLTASGDPDSLPLDFSPPDNENQLPLEEIVEQLDMYARGDTDAMTAAAVLVNGKTEDVLSTAELRLKIGWISDIEHSDLLEALTAASVRHVRTPEGARRFGQPIGSVIVRDVYLPRGQTMFGRLVKGDIVEMNGKHYQIESKPAGPGAMMSAKAFDRENPDQIVEIKSNSGRTVTTKVVANRTGQKAQLVKTDGTVENAPITVKNSEVRVGDSVRRGAMGEDFEVTSIEKIASGENMYYGRDQYGRAVSSGGFDNDPPVTVVRKDDDSVPADVTPPKIDKAPKFDPDMDGPREEEMTEEFADTGTARDATPEMADFSGDDDSVPGDIKPDYSSMTSKALMSEIQNLDRQYANLGRSKYDFGAGTAKGPVSDEDKARIDAERAKIADDLVPIREAFKVAKKREDSEPGSHKPDAGKTIRVRTQAQKVLLEKELIGQISDGMWENSSPDWQDWADAEIIVDPTNPGINWYARKNNYMLNSKTLLDIVGDRMVDYVKEDGNSDYDAKQMGADLKDLRTIFKTKRLDWTKSDAMGAAERDKAPVAFGGPGSVEHFSQAAASLFGEDAAQVAKMTKKLKDGSLSRETGSGELRYYRPEADGSYTQYANARRSELGSFKIPAPSDKAPAAAPDLGAALRGMSADDLKAYGLRLKDKDYNGRNSWVVAMTTGPNGSAIELTDTPEPKVTYPWSESAGKTVRTETPREDGFWLQTSAGVPFAGPFPDVATAIAQAKSTRGGYVDTDSTPYKPSASEMRRRAAAKKRMAAARIPGNIVGINKTNADIVPTVPEATVKPEPIKVVSSPAFLQKRRKELRAEIKRDKAEGYGTASAESNLENIEDQMREQGLLPAKKVERKTATTVSQLKRGDTIDDTIVNWATGKDKRLKVKRVGNGKGYTSLEYFDPANPDKVYTWSGGGTQQVNKFDMVDAPAPRPAPAAAAPAAAPTDVTPAAPTFVSGKSKSLGTVDPSAKGNNPERFKPKSTLADGSTPAVGTVVVDSKGRKGKIAQTYQLFSGVQWDDGKKQTLANEKLNSAGGAAPAAPAAAPTPNARTAKQIATAGGDASQIRAALRLENPTWAPKQVATVASRMAMATPSAREVADAGGDAAAIRAALRREHPEWSTQQVATVAARMLKK